MLQKGIRGGLYYAIYQQTTNSNKYKKDYDKNKESLYPKYWDTTSLYEWAM